MGLGKRDWWRERSKQTAQVVEPNKLVGKVTEILDVSLLLLGILLVFELVVLRALDFPFCGQSLVVGLILCSKKADELGWGLPKKSFFLPILLVLWNLTVEEQDGKCIRFNFLEFLLLGQWWFSIFFWHRNILTNEWLGVKQQGSCWSCVAKQEDFVEPNPHKHRTYFLTRYVAWTRRWQQVHLCWSVLTSVWTTIVVAIQESCLCIGICRLGHIESQQHDQDACWIQCRKECCCFEPCCHRHCSWRFPFSEIAVVHVNWNRPYSLSDCSSRLMLAHSSTDQEIHQYWLEFGLICHHQQHKPSRAGLDPTFWGEPLMFVQPSKIVRIFMLQDSFSPNKTKRKETQMRQRKKKRVHFSCFCWWKKPVSFFLFSKYFFGSKTVFFWREILFFPLSHKHQKKQTLQDDLSLFFLCSPSPFDDSLLWARISCCFQQNKLALLLHCCRTS